MTTPLLSPGGKRRAEKEERNCRKEARAVKRAEDDRKGKEEQGRQDAERAKKENGRNKKSKRSKGKKRKKRNERNTRTEKS